jgi:hypothetical protein
MLQERRIVQKIAEITFEIIVHLPLANRSLQSKELEIAAIIIGWHSRG